MILITGLLIFLFVTILQTLIQFEDAKHSHTPNRNLTIADVLPDSVINSWVSDPPTPKESALISGQLEADKLQSIQDKGDQYKSMENLLQLRSLTKLNKMSNEQQQSDDPSAQLREANLIDSLFKVPEADVRPDWPVVLGNFEHYDDENWSEFLTKTEVPYLVRAVLEGSSETVEIRRIDRINATDGKTESKEKRKIQLDRMSIVTSSWIFTHKSRFVLKKMFVEHDIDGTNSENTFFFATPRLLIHNKVKDNWRTAIIRHFNEKGLNMTFVDRDRMAMGRRFFHRVKE